MDVDRGGEIYLIHGVSFLRALLSVSQTGCSLMGLKKTNAAFAALVFFGTHYIITTFTLKCYWIFCQMYCQLYAFFLCTCIKTCCFPDLCYIKFERYSKENVSWSDLFINYILCRNLPVQTFYGCNQMLFTCIMYTTLFYLIFYDLMVWNWAFYS